MRVAFVLLALLSVVLLLRAVSRARGLLALLSLAMFAAWSLAVVAEQAGWVHWPREFGCSSIY